VEGIGGGYLDLPLSWHGYKSRQCWSQIEPDAFRSIFPAWLGCGLTCGWEKDGLDKGLASAPQLVLKPLSGLSKMRGKRDSGWNARWKRRDVQALAIVGYKLIGF